eukprot:scaffold51605_cov64-Phaeocystis_antarctica.AAC.3
MARPQVRTCLVGRGRRFSSPALSLCPDRTARTLRSLSPIPRASLKCPAGHGEHASSASGGFGSKPRLQPHVSLLGMGYKLPGEGGPKWQTTLTGSEKEMISPSKLTSRRCSPSPLCTMARTVASGRSTQTLDVGLKLSIVAGEVPDLSSREPVRHRYGIHVASGEGDPDQIPEENLVTAVAPPRLLIIQGRSSQRVVHRFAQHAISNVPPHARWCSSHHAHSRGHRDVDSFRLAVRVQHLDDEICQIRVQEGGFGQSTRVHEQVHRPLSCSHVDPARRAIGGEPGDSVVATRPARVEDFDECPHLGVVVRQRLVPRRVAAVDDRHGKLGQLSFRLDSFIDPNANPRGARAVQRDLRNRVQVCKGDRALKLGGDLDSDKIRQVAAVAAEIVLAVELHGHATLGAPFAQLLFEVAALERFGISHSVLFGLRAQGQAQHHRLWAVLHLELLRLGCVQRERGRRADQRHVHHSISPVHVARRRPHHGANLVLGADDSTRDSSERLLTIDGWACKRRGSRGSDIAPLQGDVQILGDQLDGWRILHLYENRPAEKRVLWEWQGRCTLAVWRIGPTCVSRSASPSDLIAARTAAPTSLCPLSGEDVSSKPTTMLRASVAAAAVKGFAGPARNSARMLSTTSTLTGGLGTPR